MNCDSIFDGQQAVITQAIRFFFASMFHQEHFEEVKSICLTNPSIANDGHKIQIQVGHFSLKDYMYYVSRVNPPNEVIPHIVAEELLRRFCDWQVLHRSELLLSMGIDFFHVQKERASFFLARGVLENLLYGFPHLVQKYATSILHLVVKDKQGDHWNGTGFLCITNKIVLTNKHVVEADAAERPRVLKSTGEEVSIKSVRKAPDNDLALIELQRPVGSIPLFPLAQVDVLDEIMTMGYPRVPLAKATPLVAHQGEVNGLVPLAHGERLLFSAKTAPGNSGGPLLNRAGLFVGMVAEEIQGGLDSTRSENANTVLSGSLPYFTAIPTSQINKFIIEAFPAIMASHTTEAPV